MVQPATTEPRVVCPVVPPVVNRFNKLAVDAGASSICLGAGRSYFCLGHGQRSSSSSDSNRVTKARASPEFARGHYTAEEGGNKGQAGIRQGDEETPAEGKRDARPPTTPEGEFDETTRQSKWPRKAKRGGSKPDGDSDEEKDGDKARKQSWIYGLQQRRSK